MRNSYWLSVIGCKRTTQNAQVVRYEDFDLEGMVFGRPEQIELDVIIHNGDIILCEIKSSISKSEMHVFYRKKEYYENKHNLRENRAMVITPMTETLALKVAEQLGIEAYSMTDAGKLSILSWKRR